MPGRQFNTQQYRFGFNGQEKDDEIKGNGNSLDFGARLYDPRLGRWLSIDPFFKETPSWTPYRFAFNNPIYWVDNDGNKEFPSYAAYVKYAKENKLKVLTEYQMYQQGHWLWLHRIRFQEGSSYEKNKADVFANAAAINTQTLASSEYVNLPQRQAYYKWADNYFTEKGFKIKWMSAAEGTVGTLSMALLPLASWFGYSNEEINTFIRNGNKLILDDMMPKIYELLSIYAKKGPLTGTDALKWDAQTLADEQNLIQALYNQLSPESVQILQENLESVYNFKGNVLNAADRWVYGMKHMGYYVTPEMMPTPGGNYEEVRLKLKTR